MLGRISSRFATGRRYASTWLPPTFAYPMPYAERLADTSGFGLGLHTEWDKWPADTVFNPRFGLHHGAGPYRIDVIDEIIDGVAVANGTIGLLYAQYPEDETSTRPYLGMRHAGFAAPSGGTRVYEWTIRATDCQGAQASLLVKLTVYARDHASFTTHFVVFDAGVAQGSNGTGTFASPKSKFAGAAANGNSSVLGTDYNVTSGFPTTQMLLVQGSGSMSIEEDMLNAPAGEERSYVIQNSSRPRQIIGIEGNTVAFRRTSAGGGRIYAVTRRDVTVRGIEFDRAGDALSGGGNQCYFLSSRRCAVVDLHFDGVQLYGAETSGASSVSCVFMTGTSVGGVPQHHNLFASHLSADNVINVDPAASGGAGNSAGILTFMDVRDSLAENIRYSGPAAAWDRPMGFAVRTKHAVHDTTFRDVEALWYDEGSSAPNYALGLTTEAGAGHSHRRVVMLRCNLARHPTSTAAFRVGLGSSDAAYALMLHACTIKGAIVISTLDDPAEPNNSELHIWACVVENAAHATNYGWGALDADWNVAPGKSAIIEDCISGDYGTLLDAEGRPLASAHIGRYGHTVLLAA